MDGARVGHSQGNESFSGPKSVGAVSDGARREGQESMGRFVGLALPQMGRLEALLRAEGHEA